MEQLTILTEQVRAVLIKSGSDVPRHQVYNQFINDCKEQKLSEDDFYKKVLKPAHASIDWDYVEAENKKNEESQKKLEKELAEQQDKIQSAPLYIDRLIEIAFEDEKVEMEELELIFNKATELSQNVHELARQIDLRLKQGKYKSYPTANMKLPSLKEILASSNWYCPTKYDKLTTPLPPKPIPPPPFPWKQLLAGIFLLLIVGVPLVYFLRFKDYLEDKKARRMYVYSTNLALRPTASDAGEAIFPIDYGGEVLVYDTLSEWPRVKAKGKRGYVSSKYLMNKQDFYELNAIFKDADARAAIRKAIYRKALFDYFKQHNFIGKMEASLQQDIYGSVRTDREIWQVFAKGRNGNDELLMPNSVDYKKLSNPNAVNSDLACLITNINTKKRKFLYFTFADTGNLTNVFEMDAPDTGYFKDIKIEQGQYMPSYE